MNAIICAAHVPASATRAAARPLGAPLLPAFGAPKAQRPASHAQHAFSLFSGAGDPEPEGPFSFFMKSADVPAAAMAARAPSSAWPRRQAFEAPGPETVDIPGGLSAGGPKQQRFRSALEQVSYLTNESAMRSTDAGRW